MGTDRIVSNLSRLSWLNGILRPKLSAILFLAISLLGVKGKMDEKETRGSIAAYLICGSIVYAASFLSLHLQEQVSTCRSRFISP